MMTMYELDNTTVYTYMVYATSSFNEISKLSTLSTSGTIIWAVIKPFVAKLSDVLGRGETYLFCITCYLLAYVLIASSSHFGAYAAGYVFYCVGQSGLNTMNDIIIADISTARWRGFAIGISFFPFLILPWCSAFITEDVVNGIGWRWGIGILSICLPFCSSLIVGTLLFFQRKAVKTGLVPPNQRRISVYDLASLIDLGGLILLSGGFAMILIPLTLAAGAPNSWKTGWIIALLVLGVVFVIALPFYELYVAKNPIVPIWYFKSLTITLSLLLIATDSLGFSCTHTYFYTWAVVARDLPIHSATFLNLANGIMQCFAGIIAGAIMYKTRQYKWLVVAAVCIRMIGYGVMIRFRRLDASLAELIIVQLVQGIGSGIIQTSIFVAATISVPHKQLAQMTALVLCSSFLGSSMGSAIAGGIYTGTFESQLAAELGTGSSQSLIDSVYNSITGILPLPGSVERIAIDQAVSPIVLKTDTI